MKTKPAATTQAGKLPDGPAVVPNAPGCESPRLLPSVCFWLCLFAGTALFGAVVLAPKILVARSLKQRADQLHWRVASLDQYNRSLERVIEAFRNDPNFAAEVARVDFDAARPGEQRLPVEPVQAFAKPPEIPGPPPAPPEPQWVTDLLRLLALDQRLRHVALWTAAGLVIVGFTCFPPPRD